MVSELTVRPFSPTADYGMVCDWWIGHQVAPLPLEILPACGFIAEDNDGPAGAMWLYIDTSTPVCFLSHVVTRPKLRLRDTVAILTELVLKLKQEAWINGAAVMMAYVPEFIARYHALTGFTKDPRHLVNLSIILTEEDAWDT